MLIHPLRVREGDLVAKNDQDKTGRSLEEQLASLDAMNSESAEPRDDAAEEDPAPANPWTNTPPAPTFPASSPDPSAQPSGEGQPPYGFGAPGYPPPPDFGAPPQYPSAPAAEYGPAFAPFPTQGFGPVSAQDAQDTGAPDQRGGAQHPGEGSAQPYDAGPADPDDGSAPYDVQQPSPPAEPEDDQGVADAERTQLVEQQRPAAEATQADGFEMYGDGGYPGYPQYSAPAFGGPPQYSPPPTGYPVPGAEQGQPYPDYGPQYPGAPDYAAQYPGRPPGPEQQEPRFPGPPPTDHPGQSYAPPPYGRQPEAAPYGRQPEAPGFPPQPEAPPYGRQPEAFAYGRQPEAPAYVQQPDEGPPFAPLPEAYGQPQSGAQTADSLSADTLLRGRRQAPANGWRRALYKASGGTIHPGESPAELRRRELLARARTPVAGGHHRVAVMSLKGGVGKTTTTVGLGATLASLRGDRVIAVDANPDRGTLSDKVRLETATTVRDLLNEHEQIQRYADVRAYTSQASSRLEVLASDRDPAVSEAFSEQDYRTVSHVLEHFYSICLTDCGTGLLHSAMAGVLGLANQLVLVSSPSVDGARSASATLDWLEAHHYGELVRNGVVVLSMVRSRSRSTVDLDRLQGHFESRCRAVVRIPYDPHLEEGAEVELEQLSAATQDAYLVLAATVGDGFAWPR
ncbi:AAA family ATPase [Actinoallomurus purpureus]|uniref:MinD/ParA family ATP-binding protein n=1 Tax=Actinoallomurus purpureus TaxID=478114 RepID=UPI00209291E9|nr:MinD/ParA family protein [Actinoallomurus purpureus]MCO6007431.1 AAA family ATPase [Actinoallomurus purpureus]